MSVATPVLMTAEEFLGLPDDGVERWLIRGHLREKAMTYRNRWHSRIEAQLVYILKRWLELAPEPRGEVFSGEAGCRLSRNPDSVVGIDILYASAEVAATESEETTILDGAPVLAVEILSPSDKEEEVNEKVDQYLEAGVKLVWVVDPHFRTIAVYRPDAEPALFNVNQEISGEPHLPGLRVKVAEVFRR